MFTLSKLQKIGSYTVAFPIKQGDYAETYRVKDSEGKNYFLKLIDLAKLSGKQFDENDNVIELDIMKGLEHPNVMHLVEQREATLGGRQMAWLVSDFISGETLEQKVSREGSNPYEVREWICNVLDGLQYLHSQPDPVIHNELTPQNVMLDATTGRAVVIDFGHARRQSGSRRTFDKKGLSPYYLAPEAMNGIYSPQSDLFSVGVMAYRLLYGQLPWQVKSGDDFEECLQKEREKPLKVMTLSRIAAPDGIVECIAKALSTRGDQRFSSAEEMAKALRGEIQVSAPAISSESAKTDNAPKPKNTKETDSAKTGRIPKGNGFKDIAGMHELKERLQTEVIDLLRNPEEYKRYKLSLPNGMLLYGPPGCGKTFFAKKLAEEVGYYFIMRTPADLKSKWVNATQENIATMFKEAEENAPSIIFIDEINELLPRRTGDAHEMSLSAVNEMLAQMDRTGDRGIFVIGATNIPEAIDDAMLRSGRFEIKIEVTPPDLEAREEMFEMYLKDRPIDFGFDFLELAKLTEGYVSADIRFITDEAARAALKAKSKITMDIMRQTLRNISPSVKTKQNNTHRPIGFK